MRLFRHREVHLAVGRLVESPRTNVSHDSDYRASLLPEEELTPDGFTARPQRVRQRLIDDGDTMHGVRQRREIFSVQRHTHRGEVARCGHQVEAEPHPRSVGRRVVGRDAEADPADAFHRQRADRGRRRDSGRRAKPLERAVEEHPLRGGVRVARARENEAAGHHLLRAKAGIGAQQRVQALQHQPRAHEQHDGERHLGHDESAARAGPSATRTSAASAGRLHRVAQVRSRRAERGRDAEHEARRQGDDHRERQHARVDPGRRHVGETLRQGRRQHAHREPRGDDGDRRARCG